MGHQKVENALFVNQDTPNPHQKTTLFAAFNDDGTPRVVPSQAAAQADSVASDVPELVADFNALLAKLRAANVMDT